MEITYFILGMLTIFAVILVAVVIWGVVKIDKLQEAVRNQEHREIENNRVLDNRFDRIYSEHSERFNHLFNDLDVRFNDVNRKIDETYSYIDSRIDKLAEKTSKKVIN